MISTNRRAELQDGERRKRDAHELLAAHRDDIVRQGQRALLDVLLDVGEATIDSVRERVTLPEGIDPKLFGAVPGALARAGIIYRDRFAFTTRPMAHARPVAVWSLRDERKAKSWLAAHPPPPPNDQGRQVAGTTAAPKTPTLFD